ncbi:PPK2 family polyphosphate kinase [Streptomyces meridianus]|uniref:Polyphosphate kinase 2 family protein n=1 Tax=Streptomyces meridianus TaxID=2938945 RepID=A0ABT0X322_9ACTN|nr:PPK2 family polyphosphate kinase [Streptomyces meridianus]MCM2576941.1 polyphosphate kinase 2 family protein [Streptomyces meridianus]
MARKRDGERSGLPRGLREQLRIPPGGSPVDLSSYDPAATPGGPPDKVKAREEALATGKRLASLQERLYAAATAGDRRRLLLVLQGTDTSGKGGTVKHVIGMLNPAGCRITAFKAPTDEERRHHFLWRIERALPRPGEIGIFDRSHYEDVLIARVRELVPAGEWSARYAEINRFEQALTDDGVAFVKVFLHISHAEQRRRLLRRLDDPSKHWKFDPGDVEERELWDHYRDAYEAMLERCSTVAAPWYVVPADRKWYRNWAVSRLLLEQLEEMDPRYPPARFDPEVYRARLATG